MSCFSDIYQVLADTEDPVDPVLTNTNYLCADNLKGYVQNVTTLDEVGVLLFLIWQALVVLVQKYYAFSKTSSIQSDRFLD